MKNFIIGVLGTIVILIAALVFVTADTVVKVEIKDLNTGETTGYETKTDWQGHTVSHSEYKIIYVSNN